MLSDLRLAMLEGRHCAVPRNPSGAFSQRILLHVHVPQRQWRLPGLRERRVARLADTTVRGFLESELGIEKY